jgi:effector-binding domain-containing protein
MGSPEAAMPSQFDASTGRYRRRAPRPGRAWAIAALAGLVVALAPMAARPAPVPDDPASTTEAKPPPPKTTPPRPNPDDPFGQEVELEAKPIVFVADTVTWEKAYGRLREAFKTVQTYIAKENLKATGHPMTIYTATEDDSFSFRAAIPVAQAPEKAPDGKIAVGTSPSGKALVFAHRGTYEDLDHLYDAIVNFLDEKSLTVRDLYIEEYMTDPVTTPDGLLVIHVIVPVK